MKGFIVVMVLGLSALFAGRVEAQSCQVQNSAATSSVSSAAAIQQQAALLQQLQLQSQLNQQRAAAVSSSVAPQTSRFFVQVPGQVAAPLAFAAPTSGAQAFASSGVAVPAPVQTFSLPQLQALQLSAFTANPVQAVAVGGCASGACGRSRSVSRAISNLRPVRNTSRSRSVSVSRSG